MFKKLLLVVAVVFMAYSMNAQFSKGDKALNIGIGIGNYYSYSSVIPAFNASFEVGIIDIPNVGVVGVAGMGTFKTAPHSYGGVYNYSTVTGRGVFHFQFFDTGDFDLYAGLGAGIGFEADSYYNYSNSYPEVEEFVGARWMKSDKFGFFAELGYGISSLKAGITMKF